ncbi:hypothetical protein C8F04DRAFT_1181639 [Mycena alexandri]|uniref:Uncharacterized protein n=1 Tax=Mycena alexandri TaxID=1745969 RepID=A0AAD6X244_9AGAR|nr:hypothetical protein C8F04DRAFT_1181639 [Mycena alexandri]
MPGIEVASSAVCLALGIRGRFSGLRWLPKTERSAECGEAQNQNALCQKTREDMHAMRKRPPQICHVFQEWMDKSCRAAVLVVPLATCNIADRLALDAEMPAAASAAGSTPEYPTIPEKEKTDVELSQTEVSSSLDCRK